MKMPHTLRHIALTLPFLATSALAATSSTTEKIAQLYGAAPDRAMVTLSPNGELLAYYHGGGKEDMVLVYSLKEKKNLTGVRAGDLGIQNLNFVNDQQLIMKAGEERHIRGYRGKGNITTAYALDIQDGKVEQLLRPGAPLANLGKVLFPAQTELGRIVGISPDRKKVYMPGFVPEDVGDRAPDLALLEVDLDNPSRPLLIEEGNSLTHDWFLNSKGEVVAQQRFSDSTQRHSISVPEGRGWREIYADEPNEPFSYIIGLTQDESALALTRTSGENGHVSFHTLDLKKGEVKKFSFNRPDVDIEDVITDPNRIAVGVIFGGFSPTYLFFDETLNRRFAKLQANFPNHSVQLQHIDSKHENLIIFVSGQTDAGSYYLSTPEEPLTFLMSAYPSIDVEQIHPTATLQFKARDGLIIPTLVTIPRSQAENPKHLPAVIMPHGGPASFDEQRFDKLAQSIAASGYAVIQPQFRGSRGFGHKLWEAGLGEWGRAMQDDLTDAVKFLGNAGFIDPSRVCIVGSSYGGYAALAGATFTPDLYRCAISIHGVSDLNGMLAYHGDEYGENNWVIDYFSRSVAKDYFTPERLAAHSPANFASGVQAPVLLIHGEDDTIVPIEQSELMHEKLKAANKSVKYIELEDTGHSHGDEESRVALYQDILNFLNTHLQPAGDS